jgi:hypothetical protein
LRGAVVGPVQRLRDNVTRGRRIQGSIVRDADRIAVDVRDRLRPASGRTSRRVRWLAVPMTAVLVLVGVVVIGSLAASYAVMSRTYTLDTGALIAETGQDTTRAATRLRSALLGGLSTLQGMSSPGQGGGMDPAETVSTVLATREVFRAVYVLDPAGRLVAAAGTRPRSVGVPPPAGIGQLNTSGSVPLIVAAASLYDGNTLIGEYDPRALNDELRVSGGRIRVVDGGLRTILSNHGYAAFSALHEPQLQTAAKAPAPAGVVPVATLRTVEDADALVAAQQLGARDDPLGPLGWVLLANQDLDDGEFAHNPTERAAAVVTGISAGMALAVLCWIYVATVRPLRRAAAHAAAIAAARRGEAPPASAPAQRMDEIGAIIAGLNRQLHAPVAAPPTPPSTTRIAAPRRAENQPNLGSPVGCAARRAQLRGLASRRPRNAQRAGQPSTSTAGSSSGTEMTYLLTFYALGCAIALIAGLVEQRRHHRQLQSIPRRIVVNGIRGKSSITRLCAGRVAGRPVS